MAKSNDFSAALRCTLKFNDSWPFRIASHQVDRKRRAGRLATTGGLHVARQISFLKGWRRLFWQASRQDSFQRLQGAGRW
ncbi:MAG TPA: hypothetical protein PKC78_04040, partial [Accumulibacter sp.]|nr:hypothetical protein [Accumulibacter sp.]